MQVTQAWLVCEGVKSKQNGDAFVLAPFHKVGLHPLRYNFGEGMIKQFPLPHEPISINSRWTAAANICLPSSLRHH
eukprot:12905571-Prorocentrum_lima.AAC.1